MKVCELYQSAVRRLVEAAISDAELEASFLLGHLLGCGRAQLFLDRERTLSPALVAEFESLLARRLAREPLAYLLGEQEFWSLTFHVTPDVLIPRPETEQLLETVLATVRDPRHPPPQMILEMGSGSGVIPIVLALELPAAMVYSLDRSRGALAVASRNARRHRVAERIRFINSDWYGGLASEPCFDLVVTNPPYVAGSVRATLQPEVRLHEPELALFGGEDGIRDLDSIISGLGRVLKAGGWFFMEIGADQGDYCLQRLQQVGGFESLAVHRDYAGLPRIVQARRVGG
ncbi:MAG: peptide chain release factor N(5)-glutamine methyltransferase [Desulfobulbaceae bacterium]|nr:peptide chain release factor N(5)-glutamine methyltransferase [Desulfobulbaceae bacterium]